MVGGTHPHRPTNIPPKTTFSIELFPTFGVNPFTPSSSELPFHPFCPAVALPVVPPRRRQPGLGPGRLRPDRPGAGRPRGDRRQRGGDARPQLERHR